MSGLNAREKSTPPVLAVAHRGGAAIAPENTLGAFRQALGLGVDMVECDVHLSKEGEVVILHDPELSRTSDGRGPVGELTLPQLRKLNAASRFQAGNWPAEPIPTLAELLDLTRGLAQVQIEIKVSKNGERYPGIEEKVVELVRRRALVGKVLIICFDFPTLVEVKRLDPRFKTGALVEKSWMAANAYKPYERIVAEVAEETGADYFMPPLSAVAEALVRAVHSRGLKIGVWVVNTEEEMRQLAGWGVDAITSDHPDLLLRVLGR